MGKRGTYESVVSIKDLEASKMIEKISHEAAFFEANSPILSQHKKQSVKGITAKVIQVVVEAGDAAPSTPVGINLPNSNWVREVYGSKSVSLGNIVEAYNLAKAKSPVMAEFAASPDVLGRVRMFGALASDLHTDMHEVIGHASGHLEPGVATPDQTLKSYANTLEEARADLVALYYILDPKLVENWRDANAGSRQSRIRFVFDERPYAPVEPPESGRKPGRGPHAQPPTECQLGDGACQSPERRYHGKTRWQNIHRHHQL